MPKAVIMAGGQGERFWPLTSEKFPKYRIRFGGKISLLQRTYQRLRTLYPADDIYVITTKDQKELIQRELPQLKASQLLLEPFRNNTAPAILFSCVQLNKKYGRNEVVSFYPADHLIQQNGLFKKTMLIAIEGAKKSEMLMVLGVKPTFPAIGYGYIQSGPPLRGLKDVYQVNRFVEKPDRRRARSYLKKGNFYWNSGIFTWKIGVLLDAMKKYSPGQGYQNRGSSIDVAVMEKADNVAFCKARMDWCDLGSWDMLLEKSSCNSGKNYLEGLTGHQELKQSLVINHGKTPLVILGVSGLLVVQTFQGTLICQKGRSEEAARLGSSFAKLARRSFGEGGVLEGR